MLEKMVTPEKQIDQFFSLCSDLVQIGRISETTWKWLVFSLVGTSIGLSVPDFETPYAPI